MHQRVNNWQTIACVDTAAELNSHWAPVTAIYDKTGAAAGLTKLLVNDGRTRAWQHAHDASREHFLQFTHTNIHSRSFTHLRLSYLHKARPRTKPSQYK